VEEGLSPYTIRTTLVTVRQLFKWALEKNHLPANPACNLHIPPVPAPDPKAVNDTCVEQLLKAAATTGPMVERIRNLALIYALRDTGGRVAGLSTARLEYLDLQHGRLEVLEKGDKRRVLYLNPP
jgi:site-specific recombinase XerD